MFSSVVTAVDHTQPIGDPKQKADLNAKTGIQIRGVQSAIDAATKEIKEILTDFKKSQTRLVE